MPNKPEENGAMARLVVLAGAGAGRRFTFDGEAVIGRGVSCDVMLDDGDVSRRHARIIRMPDDSYLLEDLGSRNGTSVDGVPTVGSVPLDFGAKIQIGAFIVLQFTRVDPVERETRQRQRLEALGRLGAGVAHDINNMLSVVLATVDFLRRMPRERVDDEVLACLDDIDAAAARAAQLTPRFVAFARSDERDHEMMDLSLVCREVIRLVERTFPRNISLDADIDNKLPVMGRTAELHQVLMNLCLNARDAMPDGGTLRIVAKRSADNVAVTITDTGVGMDSDTAAKIFEPFFSTKDNANGYGLGLATVQDIVDSHAGYIDVASEQGSGTTFSVVLPAAAEAESVRRTTRRNSVVRPSREILLLLVDDEPLVRRSAARQLKAAGFHVIESSRGPDAVEIYKQHARRPDVVLLDLDMPDMSGEETLRLLKEVDPDVLAMAVSGHDDPARMRGVLALGARAFIRKPWQPGELAAAVSAVLMADPRIADEDTG